MAETPPLPARRRKNIILRIIDRILLVWAILTALFLLYAWWKPFPYTLVTQPVMAAVAAVSDWWEGAPSDRRTRRDASGTIRVETGRMLFCPSYAAIEQQAALLVAGENDLAPTCWLTHAPMSIVIIDFGFRFSRVTYRQSDTQPWSDGPVWTVTEWLVD